MRAVVRAAGVHARPAVPWALLWVTSALVAGLLAAVARWPYAVWPLHGVALGLLAGTSAWAVDERCAAIVDVAPRPLWWRSVVRSVAPAVLVGVWLGGHAVGRANLPDHLDLFLLQGAAAAGLGFATATAARTAGRAEPGQRFAVMVIPITTGLALARPASDHLPLFPVWPHEDWSRSVAIWSALAALAVVTGAVALWHDGRARTPRRP